jgi:death-on-curing family protein
MIKHIPTKIIESLIKTTLESSGTKYTLVNKSNLSYILDSVVDINVGDEETVLLKKATYLITKTIDLHPFADGNKRAAAFMAIVFLSYNGKKLICSQDEFYDVLLGVAKRELKENDIRKWLQTMVRQK